MSIRFEAVAVDSRRPGEIAAFWAGVLGWRVTEEEADEFLVEPAPGTAEHGLMPGLVFMSVPEEKSVKNRLHLDLRPDDQAAEVARLEALGARRVDVGQDASVTWVVLADPEGNEFCVLRTLS